MTALPEPMVDEALEQRMRNVLERYFTSKNPQDWQAFVWRHKARKIAAARVAPEKADFRPALLSCPIAGSLPERSMEFDEQEENG